MSTVTSNPAGDNGAANEETGIEQNVEAKSMLQIVVSQFKDHKLAVAGFIFICAALLVAIFADVIAWAVNIDQNEQNLGHRYEAMFTTLEKSFSEREISLENFFKADAERKDRVIGQLAEAGMIQAGAAQEQVVSKFATDGLDALPNLKQLDGGDIAAFSKVVERFETFHLFGTDEVGRDVFIRLVYGTRMSIFVGIIVALAAAIIGLFIGSLAGYYGGFLDVFLMRITDSLIALPRLPILIVFSAISLAKLPFLNTMIGGDNESIWKVFIVLMIFSWMTVARLVRGSILSIREREFVLAARTLGAKDAWVIFRHITPNVIAPLLVAVTLGVGEAILSEAALSFLSLGIQPPTPSWGNMLMNAREMIFDAPHLILLPGFLILLTVMSFNFFGDGLQDAIDPKAIRR